MPPTINQPALPSTEKRQAWWQPYLIGLALLPLVYVMLVLKVGSSPILIWDEGRLAVNAAEMAQNGNWLVTYFGGQPDMWNTKPPLVIWLEVLSLRLFGYSETAFRLPTIIASISTAGLIYAFVYSRLKSVWGAVFSVLILITAFGYNDHHRARTGDYDTILTLWVTLAALSFYRYIEEKKLAAFVWTVVALVLAALSKGIAGLLWPPAFLLYAIYRRRLWWLLRRPEVYVGAATAILVILGYYLAREHYNPGYLKAVSENELGGRLLTTLEAHSHPWDYYINNMFEGKFMPWLLVFPLSLLFIWRSAFTSAQRHFALFAGLVILLHLVVISSANTKLEWYDMPIYPLASIVVGLSLGVLIQGITAWQQEQGGKRNAVYAYLLFTLVVFTSPVFRMYDRVGELYSWRRADPTLAYGFQIKSMATLMPHITDYTIVFGPAYNPSLSYYVAGAQSMYGHRITVKSKNQVEELKAGDVVVACGDEDKTAVLAKFSTATLVEEGPCITWLLKGSADTSK